MKSLSSLIIYFLIFSYSLFGQQWTWLHERTNGVVPRGTAMKSIVDEQSNFYILAQASNGIDLGPGFQVSGYNQQYLLKYNSSAELQWLKLFPGAQNVEIDHYGNIRVMLLFQYGVPSVKFSDTTLTFQTPFQGSLYVICDHNGNLQSTKKLDGILVFKTEMDNNGAIYFSGNFADTVNIDNHQIVSNDSTGIYFGKLSPSGQVKMLKSVRKSGPLSLHDMGLSEADNSLYLSLAFRDTVFWDNDTLIKQNPDTTFVRTDKALLKYDLSDGEEWNLHFQNQVNSGFEYSTMLPFSFDDQGSIYTGISMLGAYDIKNTSYSYNFPSAGGKTIIWKITTSGQIVWEKFINGGGGSLIIRNFETTSDGGLLAAGVSTGSINIENDTSISVTAPPPYANNNPFFIFKLKAGSGNFTWVRSALSPSVPCTIMDFSVTNTGVIYTAGFMSKGNLKLTPNTTLVNTTTKGFFVGIMIDTTFNDYNQNIEGLSYADENLDCFSDSTEIGLPYVPVLASPGPYYGVTDLSGNYKVSVDTGSYQLKQLSLNGPGIQGEPFCPDPTGHQITLTQNQDTLGVDFSNDVEACPYLFVTAGTFAFRRCFTNTMNFQVWNKGIISATQVKLHIKFPQYIILTGANYPYTQSGAGNTYEFDLGDIGAFQSVDLLVTDSVSCATIDLLGQTQCIQAHITPSNISFGCQVNNPDWSGANLVASGTCLNGDTAQFIIKNDSDYDMLNIEAFKVFLADTLIHIDSLQLTSQDSLEVKVITQGKDVRIEVDQANFHPFETKIISGIDGCGAGGGLEIIYNDFTPVNATSERISFCDGVIGSFDPNDKRGLPKGFGDDKIIEPGTTINYRINFQNTGTDTAFKVVLVDTLSEHLDLGSIVIQGASHPYTFNISGFQRPILTFTFDPIVLPDSNANLTESQGFVSFSIKPYSDLPLGTEVNNLADIYFDFNPPVATKWVTHTVDTIPLFPDPSSILITEDTTSVNIESDFFTNSFKLFPNPNNGQFVLEFEPESKKDNNKDVLRIFNLQGIKVKEELLSQEQMRHQTEIDVSDLAVGIYFLKVGKYSARKFIIVKD